MFAPSFRARLPATSVVSSRAVARRNRAELAFLPAALEIVETPPSPTARITAAAFSVMLAALIGWACIGKVDIVTTAPGRVVASGRTKVIQPFETSVVKAIEVSEGQRVKAGQPLVILDPTDNEAERDRAARDLMLARLDETRLRALLDDDIANFRPPGDADEDSIATSRRMMQAQAAGLSAKLGDLDHQIAEKRAELGELDAQISQIDATTPMLEAHVRIREQGIHTGYGNQLDYVDAKRGLVEQQQQRLVFQSKIPETNETIASLLRQREQAASDFRSGLLNDLAKAESTAGEKRQDLVKAAQLARLQTLRAPVDGTVQQLDIHTAGGVVTPAQPLLSIVPNDTTLEIEALVPNREVAFVQAGQAVEVKIETLEFTRYGLLHGVVESVSRDSVAYDPLHQGPVPNSKPDPSRGASASADQPPDGDPDYVARIRLTQRGLTTETGFVPLEPGMTVTTEIRTGRRRVIDYLLSPLQRYRHDVFTER